MKPTITRKSNSAHTNARKLVKNLVMSAPAEYEYGEAEAIADKAVERYLYLESRGLKVCRHPNGELRGFVLTTLDLDPYTVGDHIDSAVHDGYYVDSDYYGDENAPQFIDCGFTEADLGQVFFIVEAADISRMPGHNPDAPGSICAGMKWGKKRDDAFDEFAARFAATSGIEIKAVNALSHGLIYLHDLQRNLYETTLGQVGFIDYIQQHYDVEAALCPYGDVDSGVPEWCARRESALSRYAAVCLAR